MPRNLIPHYNGELSQVIAIEGGSHQQVDVTETAAALPILEGRTRVAIQCPASNTGSVFIGFSQSVSKTGSSTGWELTAGGSISFDMSDNIILYAVSSVGTQKVTQLELR